MFTFLFCWCKSVSNKNNLRTVFIAAKQLEQIRVYMNTVCNYFAGHFRMNKDCAYSSRVSVVKLAHCIKEMG